MRKESESAKKESESAKKESETDSVRRDRDRQREFEFRKLELEHSLELKKSELAGGTDEGHPSMRHSSSFDVTKHIRLVPPFQEQDVDKYFLHFEKVAENLK